MGSRRSAGASLAAGALALGLVAWLSFGPSGYFPDRFTAAAAAALLGLALILAAVPPRYRLSGEALVALGALVALAAWTGLSGLWSPVADAPRLDATRDLLYAALLGLGVLAAGSGRRAPRLLLGIVLVMGAVTSAALLSRLAPGTVDSTAPFGAGYRLAHPLGYWNALGAVTAMLVVLLVAAAADARLPAAGRAGAAAGVPVAAVTLELTLSRGSLLALACGLAGLVALSGARRRVAVAVALGTLASAVALWRLQAYPGLVTAPTAGDGQAAAGRAFAPQLLLVAAGAALATVLAGRLLAAADRRPLTGDRLAARRRALWSGAAATVAVVLVTAGGVAAVGGGVGEDASRASTSARDWIADRWDEATAVGQDSETGQARLGSVRSARTDLYRVALADWWSAPVHGRGAGAFEVSFARERRIVESARDAHSLELETLAELGLVGLALLLTLFGAVARAVRRALRAAMPLSRAEASAVGAALLTWLVHSAIDWDWQVPAVTGLALLLAATVLPLGTERRSSRTPRAGATRARPAPTAASAPAAPATAAPTPAGPGRSA